MSADRYVAIDEEGYFSFDGRRVDDVQLGSTLLQHLSVSETGSLQTRMAEGEAPAYVEAFDAPMIAKEVRLGAQADSGEIDLPYGVKASFPLSSLTVDEWDRFHGMTFQKIPFVLSRQAQVAFFDLLDEFDDDSVTIGGRRYLTPPWLASHEEANNSAFWTGIYRNEQPGWELGAEHPGLKEVLPQLKLNKARALVLGCGSGHDAAYLASQGHLVTGVDFSEEAIARANAQYGEREGLTFLKHDVFALPENWTGRFDLVFEHTCFCAITPERRPELVKIWRRLLMPSGHLLGFFFVHEKRQGPPFGGSEWELKQRLSGSFDFLYWTRWRRSIERRKGKELVLFARKKH